MINQIPQSTKVSEDVQIAREAARVNQLREAYYAKIEEAKSFRFLDNGKERALTPLDIFNHAKESFDTYMVAADALGCKLRAYRQQVKRAA